MKISNKIKILAIFFVLSITFSCSLNEGESLNGPQITSISEGLSRPELPQVVAGILSDMRVDMETQRDVLSVLGREYWHLQRGLSMICLGLRCLPVAWYPRSINGQSCLLVITLMEDGGCDDVVCNQSFIIFTFNGLLQPVSVCFHHWIVQIVHN